MSINTVTTEPIFLNSLSGNNIAGSQAVTLASGLSLGLFNYLNTGVSVQTIDVGTAGSGTGVGFGLLLPTSIIYPSILSFLSGSGILGQYAANMSNAIASAVSQSLSIAVVQTINVGVGVGTGNVRIVPNGSGGLIFSSALLSLNINGSMAGIYGSAVGESMDSLMTSVSGNVVISGPPSNYPGTGTGVGKII